MFCVSNIYFLNNACSVYIIIFQLQTRWNKFGVCLSHSSRRTMIQLIGKHYIDEVVEKIKRGITLRGTGDNWDKKSKKTNMRSDHQNEDYHLFSTNLIENRVDFSHLPNDDPISDIRYTRNSKFTMAVPDWQLYIDTSKVIIGRILIEFFPKFKMFDKCLPIHIQHQYTEQMSKNLP